MRPVPSALLAATALTLAACAQQPPDFGQRLQNEGGQVSALGQQWSEGAARIEAGRELVEEGRDRVEEGERMVERGRAEIRRGEKMIREGQEAQAAAKRQYEARSDS